MTTTGRGHETNLIAAPCVHFPIHASSYAVACCTAGCYESYSDILHANTLLNFTKRRRTCVIQCRGRSRTLCREGSLEVTQGCPCMHSSMTSHHNRALAETLECPRRVIAIHHKFAVKAYHQCLQSPWADQVWVLLSSAGLRLWHGQLHLVSCIFIVLYARLLDAKARTASAPPFFFPAIFRPMLDQSVPPANSTVPPDHFCIAVPLLSVIVVPGFFPQGMAKQSRWGSQRDDQSTEKPAQTKSMLKLQCQCPMMHPSWSNHCGVSPLRARVLASSRNMNFASCDDTSAPSSDGRHECRFYAREYF